MFIVSNFLLAFARITDIVLTIYTYILIGRALLSWVNPDPYNPIVMFLNRVTEPILYRVRRLIPDLGGLDISPIVVLLAIYFLQKFAVNSVYDLAFQLKAGTGAMP